MQITPFCVAFVGVLALGQDSPTFRATTELVLLDVQVVHKQTQTAIGSLQQRDFEIYEDGIAQEVKFLSRDQLPLFIVLLFDTTDTVRPVLKELSQGARLALGHLKPDDEVAVMTYAASARLMDGFTKDRDRTIAAIVRSAGEKSREADFFNEAVYQASALLKQSSNASGRRVVIWLTDGFANVPAEWMRKGWGKSVARESLHTEQEAFRDLYESGSVVTALLKRSVLTIPTVTMLAPIEGPFRKKYPPGDVNKYAERTGGETLKIGAEAPGERLAELIGELRSRYTIGYRPSITQPEGTFCKVRVALAPTAPIRATEWRVLTTAGYYRK